MCIGALLGSRDFLLFIPATTPSLRAVLSYFSATVTLNPEGDVQVGHEAIEGLGTEPFFFLLFGGEGAQEQEGPATAATTAATTTAAAAAVTAASASNTAYYYPVTQPTSRPPPSPPVRIASISLRLRSRQRHRCSSGRHCCQFPDRAPTCSTMDSLVLVEQLPMEDYQQQHAPDAADSAGACWTVAGFFAPALTSVPGSGYFLAGGMAGVVSRTATAPLDRLKVYLIAQTSAAASSASASSSSSTRQALAAAAATARHGAPLAAANAASRPLLEACRALWRAGGVRSLFAGGRPPLSTSLSPFLPCFLSGRERERERERDTMEPDKLT